MPDRVVILEFIPGDLQAIDVREEQKVQMSAIKTVYGMTPIQYGQHLKDNAVNNLAYTAYDRVNNRVLACGGVVYVTSTIGEAWAFFSSYTKTATVSIVRSIKEGLDEVDLPRVQALADTHFPEAQRFLQWLGMEPEGVLRKFNIDQTDVTIYARIK